METPVHYGWGLNWMRYPPHPLTAAVLNGGYKSRLWQLEGVTGAGGGTGQIGLASAQVVRGLWFVQVSRF